MTCVVLPIYGRGPMTVALALPNFLNGFTLSRADGFQYDSSNIALTEAARTSSVPDGRNRVLVLPL